MFWALPSFNHLDLHSSCWVSASGWINFRKCQPKSKKCIKILTTFMWTALLPPVLCSKGLTSGEQTDLCVKAENALKVCMKIHRIPKLLKFPTFFRAARCVVQVRLWFHAQWMWFCLSFYCCCEVQECSSTSSLKTNKQKILNTSVILKPVHTSYWLYFLHHCSLFIHGAKERHFYYLHYESFEMTCVSLPFLTSFLHYLITNLQLLALHSVPCKQASNP